MLTDLLTRHRFLINESEMDNNRLLVYWFRCVGGHSGSDGDPNNWIWCEIHEIMHIAYAHEFIAFVVICTRFWRWYIIHKTNVHDIQSFSFASNDNNHYVVDLFMNVPKIIQFMWRWENFTFTYNHNHNCCSVHWKLNLMLLWSSCWLNFPNRYDKCCPNDTNSNTFKHIILMHANAVRFSSFWRSRLFVLCVIILWNT